MLKNIRSKNEKYRPNLKFLKIDLFFVKGCSSGDLKYNIDNQAGNFVPKVQKHLPQTPKKNRRRIFQNRYFAQKCYLDFYYALLITLLRIFLRHWEFFAQNPTKLHIFPRKTCFSTKCSAGFYNAILTIQPKFWLTIAWNFFAENPNLSVKSL